jgi:hypothetical protein
VPPRDQLLLILRRVRRRLRGLAALQGAVLGAAAALAVGAPWLAVVRWRGDTGSLSTLVLLIVGAAVVAALIAGGRPIPLQRCARQVDRTAAGEDRALSALAFIDQPPTPFSFAAISDVVERAGGLSPAAVAPLRRPRGTLVLLAGAAALVVAVFAPLSGHRGHALATATAARATPKPALLESRDIDAETEEARAAAAAAQALDDPTLAALAKELGDALRTLTSAGLDRGSALERLAALQRQSEQAARDAAALADQLRVAGEALQATAATRPLAEALNAGDGAATEQAAADLAARAASAGATQRETLAQAFERAAKQAAASEAAALGRNGDDRSGAGSAGSASDRAGGGGDDEAPRRLQRPSASNNSQLAAGVDQNSAPPERRLQHLDRDLRDTATACRDNPAACQQQLRQSGRTLPRMQQQASGASVRQRLSQAIQQLRERLRRGNDSQPGDTPEQRRQRQQQQRFARAANGQPNAARANRRGGQRGQSDGDGNEGESDSNSDDPSGGDEPGDDGDGSGDSASAGQPAGEGIAGESSAGGSEPGQGDSQSAGGTGTATGGDGIGNENGGDALGRQKDQRTTRGHEREAAVRSAAGPKRSQVIEAAAARGFAREDYRRVFQDYGAVIEESLDATAVPPGQRYLVRRYFQLIRPRAPTTAASTLTAPPGGP